MDESPSSSSKVIVPHKSSSLQKSTSFELKPIDKTTQLPVIEEPNEKLSSIKLDLVDQINRQPATNIRHYVAILTLLAIVSANMCRQNLLQTLDKLIIDEKTEIIITTPLPTTFGNVEYQPELSETTSNMPPIVSETDSAQASEKYIRKQDVPLVQSSFQIGYVILMLPAGSFSERFGASPVILASAFGSGFCTIFGPFLLKTHIYLFAASRFLMGLAQAGISASIFTICSKWTRPDEANFYVPLLRMATIGGTLLGIASGDFLDSITSFYVSGALSLAFGLVWLLIGSSEPTGHPLVNKSELEYILSSGSQGSTKNVSSKKPNALSLSGWLKVATNKTVLAFIYTKMTIKFSTEAQAAQLPLYMGKGLGKQGSKTLLSSVNYSIQMIFTGLVAYTSMELIKRKSKFNLSKTFVRRLYQGICNFGMAGAYVLLGLVAPSVPLSLLAVIILSFSAMFTSGGEVPLPLDVTSKYQASVMAISNVVANFGGSFLPKIVQFVLKGNYEDVGNWRIVWLIVSAIVASGGLVFCTCVDAKIQSFDEQLFNDNANDNTEIVVGHQESTSVAVKSLPASKVLDDEKKVETTEDTISSKDEKVKETETEKDENENEDEDGDKEKEKEKKIKNNQVD